MKGVFVLVCQTKPLEDMGHAVCQIGVAFATRRTKQRVKRGDVTRIMTQALVDELDPEAIYLFGSHAWGEPHEDSDVDFMVVVGEEDARSLFEKSVRGMAALRPLWLAKDVITRGRNRFETRSRRTGTLEHDVLTRGRLLYGR